MFSEQGNPYSELGVDLREEGLLLDAGDVDLRPADGELEQITSAVAAALASGRKTLCLGAVCTHHGRRPGGTADPDRHPYDVTGSAKAGR